MKKRKSFEELVNEGGKKLLRFLNILEAPQPTVVRPGQVWLTKKDYWTPLGAKRAAQSYLLLVLKGTEDSSDPNEPDIEAALIHPASWMATDEDLVVPETHPIIGGAMVSFWNVGPFLIRNLDTCLGKVERKILDQCEKVWQYADGLEVMDIFGLPIGRPILSTADVRYEFQRNTLAETQFLWEPAIAVANLAAFDIGTRGISLVTGTAPAINWLKEQLAMRLPQLSAALGAEEPRTLNPELLKRHTQERLASIPEFGINVDWAFKGHTGFVIVTESGKDRVTEAKIGLKQTRGAEQREFALDEISETGAESRIFAVPPELLKLVANRKSTLNLFVQNVNLLIPLFFEE